MIFAAECAEIVDIPGICGYNVSVILDKYAPAEMQVLCTARGKHPRRLKGAVTHG